MLRKSAQLFCSAVAATSTPSSPQTQPTTPPTTPAFPPFPVHIPKYKFPDHSSKSKEELISLLLRREDEVKQLIKIHEVSLRRLEQAHRRHLLEYEDKGLSFVGNSGKISLDHHTDAGFTIKMRNKVQTLVAKEKTWITWWCLGLTFIMWIFLIYTYPYNKDRKQRAVSLQATYTVGAVWSPFEYGFSGKAREIKLD
eukprot:PhF_6_TR31125/c0_g1_i3/m.45562